MSEAHTYKVIEIVGSSSEGMDGAIRNGIRKAQESVRNLRWFEVTDTRGWITDGEVGHFQVTMKIGFTLE